MKILITGAAGKLGSKLREVLGSTNELVLLSHVAIDSPSTKNYTVTLDDPTLLTKIISEEKPEAIIHLSALVGPECEANPTLAQKINVEETKILAEVASQQQVKKFIFPSTAAVYHQTLLKPTGESDNIDPQSIYGQTKLAAEKTLETIANGSTTQFVVFRIFNIYGAGFKGSLVNMLLNSSVEQPVTLLDPQNCYRDYIHVDDVAAAFEQVLQVQLPTIYSVMNIASGMATSNAELLQAIKLHGGQPYFTIKPSGLSVLWADIAGAKAIINFNPAKSIALKEGQVA